MPEFHLAQINIGRLVAPPDDPRIADFISQLDTINALAERSPGFVWRLKSGSPEASDIPFDEDPSVMVNMSVWETIEALRDFTYRSGHVGALRERAKWFEKPSAPHYCLWWIAAGQVPTTKDARDRLQMYGNLGPTPQAFWFGQTFPAPSVMAAQ